MAVSPASSQLSLPIRSREESPASGMEESVRQIYSASEIPLRPTIRPITVYTSVEYEKKTGRKFSLQLSYELLAQAGVIEDGEKKETFLEAIELFQIKKPANHADPKPMTLRFGEWVNENLKRYDFEAVLNRENESVAELRIYEAVSNEVGETEELRPYLSLSIEKPAAPGKRPLSPTAAALYASVNKKHLAQAPFSATQTVAGAESSRSQDAGKKEFSYDAITPDLAAVYAWQGKSVIALGTQLLQNDYSPETLNTIKGLLARINNPFFEKSALGDFRSWVDHKVSKDLSGNALSLRAKIYPNLPSRLAARSVIPETHWEKIPEHARKQYVSYYDDFDEFLCGNGKHINNLLPEKNAEASQDPENFREFIQLIHDFSIIKKGQIVRGAMYLWRESAITLPLEEKISSIKDYNRKIVRRLSEYSFINNYKNDDFIQLIKSIKNSPDHPIYKDIQKFTGRQDFSTAFNNLIEIYS